MKQVMFAVWCIGTLIGIWSWDPSSSFGNSAPPVKLELTLEERQFLETHPVIRVSNELDWPPFDFAIAGQPFGLSIDLMRILGNRLGLTFDYINGYRWNELVDLFRKGKIDVLQSVYKTEARSEFGLFTQPYFRGKTVFIIPRHATPVSSIDQLFGKTVAGPKGWAYEEFIAKQYPEIQLLSVKNMEAAFRAIVDGKADAAVELSAVAQYMFEKHYLDGLKISGWFKEYDNGQKKSLHLLVRKDWPLLHGMLEKALSSLSPGELIDLEKKWLGYRNIYPSQKLSLSPEEQAFLQANPMIRVANELDWPPFDFVENGKPAGFVMDYIALITEMVGIEIEVVNGFAWSELLTMGREKKIDLFPGIWQTPERQAFLKFTQPYMSLPKVLVAVNDDLNAYSSLEAMVGKKIALTEGYGTTELVMAEHPGPDYVIVPNNASGLEQLAMGRVDGFVGSLGVINHIVKKHFISDVKVVMEVKLSSNFPLQMAVRNDWPILQRILDKAIENISTEQYQGLVEKWIGTIGAVGAPQKLDSLTLEERRYLEKKKNLCIRIENGEDQPYERVSESGNYEGIVAQFYQLIGEKLNIPIKWKVATPTQLGPRRMDQQQCDLISVVMTTDDIKIPDLRLTDPYIEYPLVIATDHRALFIDSLENVSEKRIGLVDNAPFYELLTSHYPGIQFELVPSLHQGLVEVQKGNLFGVIDTAPKVGFQIQDQQLLDLKISGEIPHKVAFKVGIPKENPLLFSIMEKAIHSLTPEEKRQIFHNWIRITYQKGIDYRLLGKLGAGLFLIVAFFLYRQVSVTRYNRKLFALNSELKTANKKLEEISFIDGLTGISNRRRFDEVLTMEWQRCERNQHRLSLIMMDIDYFKRYNDRYGHLAGDGCLKLVAQALKAVPGRNSDFAARYGGEEFAVILPDTDEEGAHEIAKKILNTVRNLKIPHEDSLVREFVTVSLGVCTVTPRRNMEPKTLVDCADQQLYRAKKEGRDRYVFSNL